MHVMAQQGFLMAIPLLKLKFYRPQVPSGVYVLEHNGRNALSY